MKDKDYRVNIDRQSGYINTECMPATKLFVKCIICGNDVAINIWENTPKVCEGCKNAVRFAKAMCGGEQ